MTDDTAKQQKRETKSREPKDMRPFWEVRREREEAQKAIQAEIKKERRKAVSEVRKLIKEYEISPRELWDWLCINGGDVFIREKILAEMKRDEN